MKSPTYKRTVRAGLMSLLVLCLAGLPFSQAGASAYYCGAQCNNQFSTWRIPSNGIRCADSQVQIASGHPTASYERIGVTDKDAGWYTETEQTMTVKVMYSKTCQTMWAILTNNGTNGRTACAAYLHRTLAPAWNSINYGCPGVGTSRSTHMVDDHGGAAAANVSVGEQMDRFTCNVIPGGEGLCLDEELSIHFAYDYKY